MDLVNAIVGMQRASTLSQVQMKVARKALDMQELQGSAMVRLIESAGEIVAKKGDELVAAATGLGGRLDAYG